MKLAITGIGMVSPLGRDVVSSCASLRAGFTRSREITYFQAVDEDATAAPVVGHSIPAYTEGFYFIGRWLRLAIGCIEDLLTQADLPDPTDLSFWRTTQLIVVVPVVDDRYMLSEVPSAAFFETYFVQRLIDHFGLAQVVSGSELIHGGHAGTITAIHHAMHAISQPQPKFERCIIVAVDSYVEPTTLTWLTRHQRLKTANTLVGLQPGEAGACVLLESVSSADRRGATIEALLSGAAIAEEANHFFSGTPSQGVALSQAIHVCLSTSAKEEPFSGDMITDLNGEVWRAFEFSAAHVRLGHEVIGPDARMITPCVGMGDTGTASAAIGLCIAVRSLKRGYAQGNRSLVTASSDYGQVGAACVAMA